MSFIYESMFVNRIGNFCTHCDFNFCNQFLEGRFSNWCVNILFNKRSIKEQQKYVCHVNPTVVCG